MQKAKLSDRLLGALALGAAILCLVGAALDLNANAADQPSGALLPIRLAVLLGLGVVSALAAWWLWTGRAGLPVRDESAAPLFGRAAGPLPVTRSRLRPLLAIVAIVALLAVAADRLGLHAIRREDPGAGSEIAEAPASPGRLRLRANPPRLRLPPIPRRRLSPKRRRPKPRRPSTGAGRPAAGPGCTSAGSGRGAARSPPTPADQPPEVALAPPAAPPETVAPPPAAPPEVETLPEGHRDAVVWLDVSPDGKTLVSASTDRTIKALGPRGQALAARSRRAQGHGAHRRCSCPAEQRC